MILAGTIVWALVQVWFGLASDRVSITIHPTQAACQAERASDASSAVCLGPYEKNGAPK